MVGTVIIAARVDGQVRPLRLDATADRWQPLGDASDAHLFPTDVTAAGALLSIVTRGEHEGDHVEQLAWIVGDTVVPFGPRAGAIRNPTAAGGVLVVESSAAGFRDLYRIDHVTPPDHVAPPGPVAPPDHSDRRARRARPAAAPRVTRLTDDPAGNFEPALSPDGATLVFTSSRDGDAELYRLPVAGGRATRLTASARDDWGARWSPDGRRLVFLSDREGSPRAFVMDADGTDLRRLTDETDPDVEEDTPRWSPDGRTIALCRARAGAAAIVLVPVDGAGAGANAAPSITPAGADDREPTWSPDGAYLLVARRRPPGTPHVAFVRVADGALAAEDAALEPLALRWFPPTGPAVRRGSLP